MSSVADNEKKQAETGSTAANTSQQGTLAIVPAGWPPSPNSLEKSGLGYYFSICFDIACIIAALPFFALAGAAAKLDGHSASDNQWWWIYGAMNTVRSFHLDDII
jgi:hypothetical protein